jgi:hypothetical protein
MGKICWPEEPGLHSESPYKVQLQMQSRGIGQSSSASPWLTRGVIPLSLIHHDSVLPDGFDEIISEKERYKSFNLLAGDMKTHKT